MQHRTTQRDAWAGGFAVALALGLMTLLAISLPSIADAAKRTKTKGKVCVVRGGDTVCKKQSKTRLKAGKTYAYKGKTRRAKRGDKVIFHYKDRSDTIYGEGNPRWVRFDGSAAQRGRAVFTPDRRRAKDKVNKRGRWQIRFIPEVTGKYVLRATYKGSKKRKNSRDKQRIKVRG